MPPHARRLSPETLPALFHGTVPRLPATLAYRAGLVAVATLTLLLPLVYLSLTLGSGAFAYWWATSAWALLPSWGVYPRMVLWLVPATMAATVCAFMLKPLLARSRRCAPPVEVDRTEEPLLFAFVEQISALVGAPPPERIYVDCHVNASAAFHEGLRGLLRDRLVLTVGMPLLAAMHTRELAGVLAHELGHFRQGAGMRATYLIRCAGGWLRAALDECDGWERRLGRRGGRACSVWLAPLGLLARVPIQLVRGLLLALLAAGEGAGHYMLRQMEYDADRHEVQVAGSAQFRPTSLHLRLLLQAFEAVAADLARLWEQRKLVEDLPSAVASKAQALAANPAANIPRSAPGPVPRWRSTHPADAERIRRAERQKAPGVFRLELPARHLLQHYESLTGRVTRHFYAQELRLEAADEQLVGGEEMRASVADTRADEEALRAYCGELFSSQRFLCPPPLAVFDSLTEAARRSRIDTLVDELQRAAPRIRTLGQRYERTHHELTTTYVARVFHAERIHPRHWPRRYDDELLARLRRELDEVKAELAPLERALGERLAIGLTGHVKQWRDEKRTREVKGLLALQRTLARLQDDYDALHRDAVALYHMLELAAHHRSARGTVPVSGRALRNQTRSLQRTERRIQQTLRGLPYPLERAGDAEDTLAHIAEELPGGPNDAPDAVVTRAIALSQALGRLHARATTRLVRLARDYEAHSRAATLDAREREHSPKAARLAR